MLDGLLKLLGQAGHTVQQAAGNVGNNVQHPQNILNNLARGVSNVAHAVSPPPDNKVYGLGPTRAANIMDLINGATGKYGLGPPPPPFNPSFGGNFAPSGPDQAIPQRPGGSPFVGQDQLIPTAIGSHVNPAMKYDIKTQILQHYYKPDTPYTPGMQASPQDFNVPGMQNALYAHGFYPTGFSPSGSWDPQTNAALVAAQRKMTPSPNLGGTN